MSYRRTKKSKKLWSERALAKKERIRLENSEPIPILEDDFIEIKVKRKATGEDVTFELFPGNRCDNYRVYCNDEFKGVMGITKVCEGLRKALPRFMSESNF